MPYTNVGLPFVEGPGEHASYKAAVAAAPTRRRKLQLYLETLEADGPLSDHQAAAKTGLPLSSICSLRNAAMDIGEVVRAEGETLSPYRQKVSLWRRSRRDEKWRVMHGQLDPKTRQGFTE